MNVQVQRPQIPGTADVYAEPTKEGDIPRAMNCLRNAVDGLSSRISYLRERLSPVMSLPPEVRHETSIKGVDPQCALSGEIQSLNDQVLELQNNVQYMLSNLQA